MFNIWFMIPVGIITILLPIALGYWLARRFDASWRLFFIGVVSFILSQLLHIPFNLIMVPPVQKGVAGLAFPWSVVLLAIFLGLSAGVFEEVTRYMIYNQWATRARKWTQGMMLGAGHGGIEAIWVGVTVLITGSALGSIAMGYIEYPMTADVAPLVEAQVAAIADLPWYLVTLSFIERVFAVLLHLALSLMVMRAVTEKRKIWLYLAIGWHALLDAVAVLVVQVGTLLWGEIVGGIAAEVAIGLIALIMLAYIIQAYRAQPEEVVVEPEPLPPPVELKRRAVSGEALDRSRFNS